MASDIPVFCSLGLFDGQKCAGVKTKTSRYIRLVELKFSFDKRFCDISHPTLLRLI
ncbi:hypothetical protein SERLA73DRAFT_191341 [Serpula lacrymans var. lacrymans S7.3]|uniref:Uncharacterized protein n=1 Tax=Serpula lacrymans var. lacrymans (strain S7.3) TaxID=936435 RepID=F8QHB8_SERL3|nr:hypothetical protein SERLA73DRAFT_191341 [Serpula lacrymans var. lacrymans S7.3]